MSTPILKQPEEGDPCPQPSCEGRLHYPPVESCSCHINPPCNACVTQLLVCPDCGWAEGDEIECEHEWEVRDDSFDHEFGTERIPPYEKCLLCDAVRECSPYEELEERSDRDHDADVFESVCAALDRKEA